MDLINNKIILPDKSCTGCNACMNICPVGAIVMVENEYGFIHPKIDPSICIKCHLCEKTCPVYVPTPKFEPQKIYATECKNKKIQINSASAGMSYYLCKKIIEEGGVAYGCSEKNYFIIGHVRIEKSEDLYKLQNSKYVQSDIGLILQEVRNDLLNGRKVIFTGTPCHIGGLLNYLRKPFQNLITVDIVCHGVPPMRMLKDQVESYKEIKKFKREELKVDFRWKEKNKTNYEIKLGFKLFYEKDDKQIPIIKNEGINNAYIRAFQKGYSLRESCFNCQYASFKRVSDLTIGDFWGIGTSIPSSFNSKNGVSLVMINSLKGQDIFTNIKQNFENEEHTLDEALLHNTCLNHPFPKPSKRDIFLQLYIKKGLESAIKYTDLNYRFENKIIIKKLRSKKILNYILNIVLKFIRNLK